MFLSVTLSIMVSLKIIGAELFRTFLEKIISFDLLALKTTFHVIAQENILFKSLFN